MSTIMCFLSFRRATIASKIIYKVSLSTWDTFVRAFFLSSGPVIAASQTNMDQGDQKLYKITIQENLLQKLVKYAE